MRGRERIRTMQSNCDGVSGMVVAFEEKVTYKVSKVVTPKYPSLGWLERESSGLKYWVFKPLLRPISMSRTRWYVHARAHTHTPYTSIHAHVSTSRKKNPQTKNLIYGCSFSHSALLGLLYSLNILCIYIMVSDFMFLWDICICKYVCLCLYVFLWLFSFSFSVLYYSGLFCFILLLLIF